MAHLSNELVFCIDISLISQYIVKGGCQGKDEVGIEFYKAIICRSIVRGRIQKDDQREWIVIRLLLIGLYSWLLGSPRLIRGL